jgi:hypothetical protein
MWVRHYRSLRLDLSKGNANRTRGPNPSFMLVSLRLWEGRGLVQPLFCSQWDMTQTATFTPSA